MRSNMTGERVAANLAATDDALAMLVDDVLAGELRCDSHDELAGLHKSTRRLQARLEYVVLATVREVDTRGSHVEDGALSMASWTRWQTRMAPWEATAAVKTARALCSGELPGTSAALAAGEIDPAHVRAIAAGVADTPAGAFALIEDEALTVAREADPRLVASLMRRFAHALDPDSADEAAIRRHDRRGVTLSPMPDGSVHIRGLADEVNGAIMMTAIDAASALVSGESRTAPQRRLDALADICRRYLASPDAPSSGGGHAHLIVTLDGDDLTGPDQQMWGDDQADDNSDPAVDRPEVDRPAVDQPEVDQPAVDRPAVGPDDQDAHGNDGSDEHDARTNPTSPTDSAAWPGWAGGPRCRGGALGSAQPSAGPTPDPTTGRGAGPGGTLSWVGPIAASTARRVGCDADITYIRISGQGAAEVVGREKRFFTWSQKKAMISRDGDRCCVPYCDRPVTWADGHHIKFWGHGGSTRIVNGALPCAAHHPMFHEGGWALRRLPDGRYVIERNGRVIGPEPHPPGHNRPLRHPVPLC